MREYFLNADFDPTLRGEPSLLATAEATYIHEMAWHFLFAAGTQDSVVVHQPLPPDFLAFMESKSLSLPRIVLHPNLTSEFQFTPFGWNVYTEGLGQRYSQSPAHPPLDIIKRANSRDFSQAVEQAWAQIDGLDWSEAEYGGMFDGWEALEAFLLGHPRPEGWMVKGDHGHAGTGNRHLQMGPLSEEDRAWMIALFAKHGKVALEPWHTRILDMSANFHVEKDGTIQDFRGHELFNSRDGTFLGVKLLPDRLPPEPWGPALRAAAERLALDLHGIGYFGPVSLDAYVRESPQGPILRSVVDINARHSMALPIHGLGHRLPGKTLLWTWMKPRKLDLPGNYVELDNRLGQSAYNPFTQTGILPISPIWHASQKAMTKRIGFLFSADDEDELITLRSHFLQALGRK